MNYDDWKTTDPDDRYLGPTPAEREQEELDEYDAEHELS